MCVLPSRGAGEPCSRPARLRAIPGRVLMLVVKLQGNTNHGVLLHMCIRSGPESDGSTLMMQAMGAEAFYMMVVMLPLWMTRANRNHTILLVPMTIHIVPLERFLQRSVNLRASASAVTRLQEQPGK